jgi:hypothetical protein
VPQSLANWWCWCIGCQAGFLLLLGWYVCLRWCCMFVGFAVNVVALLLGGFGNAGPKQPSACKVVWMLSALVWPHIAHGVHACLTVQRVLHPRTMQSLSCVLTHALYLWWVTGWKALPCNPAWVRGSMRPCKACLLAHASPLPQHHVLYDCGSSCKVPGLRCATATKHQDVGLCHCEQWVSGRLPHPQRRYAYAGNAA